MNLALEKRERVTTEEAKAEVRWEVKFERSLGLLRMCLQLIALEKVKEHLINGRWQLEKLRHS